MNALDTILSEAGIDLASEGGSALLTALYEREDQIADLIHMAATQFGMYPEIVAEVLTNAVDIGSPKSDEVHMLIRQNFINLMTRLQQENGN